MTTAESSTSKTPTTTTSEFESEEISIETTVPTDLTLSPESDLSRRMKPAAHLNPVTKQLLERKQLLHDLQLLKIELSQRELTIDNLKADFMARTEELEEKLAEATHQKNVLQARLESQVKIQQDEFQRRYDRSKLEMNAILMKQKELEMVNAQLQEKAGEVKRSLYNLELTDDQYTQLKAAFDSSDLSLRDYIAVKVYEIQQPYKHDLETTTRKLVHMTEENKLLQQSNRQLQESLERAKDTNSALIGKSSRIVSELNDVKSQVKVGDFRIENYEKIKVERDKLLEECLENKTKLKSFEVTNEAIKNELQEIKSEKKEIQQKLSLLQQDKDFLNKRNIELTSSARLVEDQLAKTSLQLEKAIQAREEIYGKYVASRDLYKTEFERKLQDELDVIQRNTASEIEILKRTVKESHEQEIRSLRDARDLAISQREKAESLERQKGSKYERLLEKLRQLQNSSTTQVNTLKSQVTLKAFELEQLKLVHGETQKSLEECRVENERLEKKVEILSKEFHAMEQKMQKQINLLEIERSDKVNKLSVYERLEKNLDEVIMQAAEVSEGGDGERLLLNIGQEFGLQTSMKRRLEHSFHLAKRVLLVEKQNELLKQNLGDATTKVNNLTDELARSKDLLNQVNKPSSYLLDTIRLRDEEIKQHKLNISICEEQIRFLQKERQDLESKVELLANDLEKLSKNREEIASMKQLLVTSFPAQFKRMNIFTAAPTTDKASTKTELANSKSTRKPVFR